MAVFRRGKLGLNMQAIVQRADVFHLSRILPRHMTTLLRQAGEQGGSAGSPILLDRWRSDHVVPSSRGTFASGLHTVRASTIMASLLSRAAHPSVSFTSRKTAHRTFSSAMAQRRIANPALFICDLQEKFRPAIHEFPKVVSTAQKLLKASKLLNIPVFATTQNRARLGETCPELKLDQPDGIQTVCHVDKTLFSMITPQVKQALDSLNVSGPLSCIIVGIESHICVTQTTLDLLRSGHKVYVIADGVSSCNKEEVPIALARLRHEGAVITTSESFMYEFVGDAGTPEFKEIIKVVKETSQSTKDAMQTLCKI